MYISLYISLFLSASFVGEVVIKTIQKWANLVTLVVTTFKSKFICISVPPRWLLPPTDVQVMLGDPVTMDCLVSGTPKPSIRWSVADEKVPGKFDDIQSVLTDYR